MQLVVADIGIFGVGGRFPYSRGRPLEIIGFCKSVLTVSSCRERDARSGGDGMTTHGREDMGIRLRGKRENDWKQFRSQGENDSSVGERVNCFRSLSRPRNLW